jgi:L-fuculose-phosphate aldolase
MPATLTLRRQVVTVCRRLYDRGLIAGTDGNVSVRVAPDVMLITPAGMSKVEVEADDLVEVAWDVSPRRMAGRASTESAMHVRLYREREDVGAIVHAHPPITTAFASAGAAIPTDVLPEMLFQLGNIAYVPFVMPGSEALADAMQPFLREHDVFVLANHGATTVGATLAHAHRRMESLEHGARIVWLAQALGGARTLPADAIAALGAARAEARAVERRETPNESRSRS